MYILYALYVYYVYINVSYTYIYIYIYHIRNMRADKCRQTFEPI